MCVDYVVLCVFFFNDTATTEIYTYLHTLSLHDALPISSRIFSSETVTKLRRRVLVCGSAPAKNGAPGTNATLFWMARASNWVPSICAGSVTQMNIDRKSTRLNSSH